MVQGTGHMVQGAGHMVQGAGHMVQGAGHMVQGTGHMVWGTKYVLIAARDPEPHSRYIVDVALSAQPPNEQNLAWARPELGRTLQQP